MLFTPFDQFFPELAEEETRTFTILDDSKQSAGRTYGLPKDTYTLWESYCSEPDCDCRRVFFSVHSSKTNKLEAVVAYGWESQAFYAKWMGTDDPDMSKMMKGPILNPGSPQSDHAPAILNIIETGILKDKNYVNRLKRHYGLIKSVADQPKKKNRTKYKQRNVKRSLGFQPYSRKRE